MAGCDPLPDTEYRPRALDPFSRVEGPRTAASGAEPTVTAG